ncbi:hypothetical protein Bca52824_018159 [Brassica carinata]|uniref:Uncharacterized protein n=1 Tax=Brassica carinata TaxID=52824 RepID=A0A8X8AY62_BRACI|nr:hypothetical protein Bca52824_018159 [Brassica carinata]
MDSWFDLTRSNNHFKLSDSIIAIRLNEFIKLVGVHAVANPIPTEMFKFPFPNSYTRLKTGVCQPRVMIMTIINTKFVGVTMLEEDYIVAENMSTEAAMK